MIKYVIKRDLSKVFCDGQKIAIAISKAVNSSGEKNVDCEKLASEVLDEISKDNKTEATVEEIQNTVEKVLIKNNYSETAKQYILYRENRRNLREGKIIIDKTIELFDNYIDDRDWKIQENANTKKSINGLNNYVREAFTKQYWLNNIYDEQIRNAHVNGDLHIHDLGFFGPYCCGWDIRQLLMMGLGGVEGKVSSGPAKHLGALLGQIVNATFSTQGEAAGAQAWSSIDTYAAPFIRYDKLSYEEVKQNLQEFIFNLNVPTRVGFQCPFSNLTFDLKAPSTLKDIPVIIGGEYMEDAVYGDFQEEMDMFNKAFCEVMAHGDNSGRVFTFPIPTINVTKDFDWDSPVVDAFMQITCKYGIPYFSNYINSDLSPEDALSMCCRLRLDTSELRKRGGGLFGSNPLTGSIGVVTLNLPRLGYTSKTEDEFFEKLINLCKLAKRSLDIKRKTVERMTDVGMYPYAARWLSDVHSKHGMWWENHFSTIGIVGMNECCLNLIKKDLTTPEGQDFADRVLGTLRAMITNFQIETGLYFNLEATPAEGTSYRLAELDKKKYPDIITAGTEVPYYTNSSQLPVGYTDDIFETLDLQDNLQCKYTGGTVLHLYIGESLPSTSVAKDLIKKVFTNYKLPYISITPTFSTCTDHGYFSGEHKKCPKCDKDMEVWTRVVGYLRPVQDFHIGKKEEYKERKLYKV